ncbi:MAG TPA: ABC transporter permease [Solirubrobacterales bacterium]|jgi:ABC-type nitrate/sulfonate/bicarbonate transport system permease component
MRRWLLPTLFLAGLIAVWQIAATTGVIADALNLEPYLVPSPSEVATSLWDSRSLLAENAWVTLQEMLFGLCIGLIVGVSFAVAMHLSSGVREATYPLLVISQTIPIVVIAPILVLWLGYGIWPKLVVVALICFFPVAVNTLDGLRSVDRETTKMMRTLDASRGQILWRVEAPGALPYFFSGARIAATIAPIGAVFGEWVGADSGLGHLILQDNAQLETARVFAATAVLSAIALSLFGLLALAERRIVTWR